jgi:hypothetical protein
VSELKTTAALSVLLAAGVGGLFLHYDSRLVPAQTVEEDRAAEVGGIASRLDGSRLARLLVLSQKADAKGMMRTTSLFVEYKSDGTTPASTRLIESAGDQLDVQSRTVVLGAGEDSLLAGKRVVFFTTAVGADQQPVELETPGEVPDYYHDDVLPADGIERQVFAAAWKAADGRVGQVQLKLSAEALYRIEVGRDGGLSAASEPLDESQRRMLEQAVGR